MILDDIKQANIEAMRQKDTISRTILGILMNKGLLETIKKREKGESLSDVDMVAILQKTMKELQEEKENYLKVSNENMAQTIEKQKQIVSAFLPKMMSEEEIRNIILSLDDKSVPAVMKKFKVEYAGKCDMRLVGEVLKTI